MASVLKEGSLEKWSNSKRLFYPVYGKLLSTGYFQWFDSVSSSSPKRSIDIRAVSAFLAFGQVLHQVPCKPSALAECDINRSFGVPHEAHQATAVSFFRCASQAELDSWMNAVNTILFGGKDLNPGVTSVQIPQTASGPYQSYAPPIGGYPPQGTVAPPPLPVAFDAYPGAGQPVGYPPPVPPPPMANYGPSAVPIGAPMGGSPYGQPPPPPQPNYAGYQPSAPGAVPPGPSYGYAQPQAPQQPYMFDKKGKPYTIVYKDGKPKKRSGRRPLSVWRREQPQATSRARCSAVWGAPSATVWVAGGVAGVVPSVGAAAGPP
uniref:PH domain-containing protein n=2 Tax=Mesocestoides corti TaxID=53468 RepID=A0A5K3F734_MESCO